MKSFKTITEDNDYRLEPYNDHGSKIFHLDKHVGNFELIPRVMHQTNDKQSIMVDRYHVTKPAGFKGSYQEKDCNTMSEAKRHAMTQYHLGMMKWKN
jgi:hypothetical protein